MRALPWIVLLALTGPVAQAGPAGVGGRSAVEDAVVERWDRGDAVRNLFEPIELALPRRPVQRAYQPLEFRLGEQAPTSLALRIDFAGAGAFYVSADLSGGLPRLDAVDGETYFAPGIEVALVGGLNLFAEDFQPASGVVGGGADADEDPWVPERSWDGHQITVGLRWRPADGVTVEAGVVAYALSVSGRRDASGATGQISVSF